MKNIRIKTIHTIHTIHYRAKIRKGEKEIRKEERGKRIEE